MVVELRSEVCRGDRPQGSNLVCVVLHGGPRLPELSGKVALLHKWFSHGCLAMVRQTTPATMVCLDTQTPKQLSPVTMMVA